MINPAHWQPAAGKLLEPNASKAVTTQDGHVVVTAGPGAGKTELLAQRADFLLTTGLSPYPKRILAISFKVDAARNIRERVRARCGDQLAARFDSFTFHAFAKRLVDNYRVMLTGQNALVPDYGLDAKTRVQGTQITFDDLIEFALEILERSPYARNSLRQTYSHIFLDEFQDANEGQYKLLKEVFLNSGVVVTAVGDVKQRIMGFAGALEGILETFADDFAADSVTLYQNYRSAPVLRRMQNRMIQVLEPGAAVPVEQLAGDAGVVRVHPFADAIDEAETLTDLIESWLAEGVPPSEIAILVRQTPNLVCRSLGERLHAKGIAFRNEQERQDVIAEPAGALVLHFLRVLTSNRQPEAYEELMRLASRSSGTEERLQRGKSEISRFLASKRRLVSASEFDPANPTSWSNLVYEFLRLVTRPVVTALSPEYQRGNRVDQVIVEAVEAFQAELVKDSDPVAAIGRLSETHAVRILTIHKCKGLEFKKVIVLGVETQLFWGDPLNSQAEYFVAISRAKEELHLTYARTRARPADYTSRWDAGRTPYNQFLQYAVDAQVP